MEDRKMASWPIVAALLVVVVLVATGAYVGGYFATSKFYVIRGHVMCRVFRHEWQAKIYAPILATESALRGQRVYGSPWGRTAPVDNQYP
jgi:hypothetical protein